MATRPLDVIGAPALVTFRKGRLSGTTWFRAPGTTCITMVRQKVTDDFGDTNGIRNKT